MGEVTGYTAARMKAIEDACIVNGAIDLAGHLQLTRHDTTQIDAGLLLDPAQIPAGLFKIAGTVLAAPAASFNFPTIPTTYDSLKIKGHLRSVASGTNFDNLRLTCNTDATEANYFYQSHQVSNTVYAATNNLGATNARSGTLISAGSAPANMFSNIEIDIPAYHSAHTKTLHMKVDLVLALTAGNIFQRQMFYVWNSTAAINRVFLDLLTGNNFATGSTMTLYGIKN